MIVDALHGLRDNAGDDRVWLLCVAILGRYPTEEEVLDVRQRSRTESALKVATDLLTREWGTRGAGSGLELEIVQDHHIVDVDFSAKTLHNTGIQRVVRSTAPYLAKRDHAILTAWSDADRGLRRLSEEEAIRVGCDPLDAAPIDAPIRLLVPIGGTCLLTEVPSDDRAASMSALARFSSAAVSVIGYDAIPITSRQYVNRREAIKFAKYLTVVKWSSSVAAISAAAASEFRGFARMLGSQGLSGPRVVECSLPADPVREVVVVDRERPLVVVVGSKEPRKNHVAVLFAAERLWREGLDFELFFVGTFGWDTRLFRTWLKRLQRAGRPVSAPARVGDDGLWRAYTEARFTMFPSLHEGYGLPVAESLAYGTPVITTAYGSTGEIAAGGGCLTVDPRDDGQIVAAMRELLTDDALLDRLRAEARSRVVKTWAEYADEVWSVVVSDR